MAKVNLIDSRKSIRFFDLSVGQLFVFNCELYVKTNRLPNVFNALSIEGGEGYKTFDHNICALAVESIDVHL